MIGKESRAPQPRREAAEPRSHTKGPRGRREAAGGQEQGQRGQEQAAPQREARRAIAGAGSRRAARPAIIVPYGLPLCRRAAGAAAGEQAAPQESRGSPAKGRASLFVPYTLH